LFGTPEKWDYRHSIHASMQPSKGLHQAAFALLSKQKYQIRNSVGKKVHEILFNNATYKQGLLF
jgi:hypothetical protein